MNTIKYLILCNFALFAPTIKAQSDTLTKKNKGVVEAGVNLASMTLRPGNFYTRYNLIMDNQAFSGLYLKYHTGKNALRWEFNFSQRNLRYDAADRGSFSKSEDVTKSLELKMGYQRTLTGKKFSFYYFADLEYNYFWGTNPNYYYPLAYESYIAPMPYYQSGHYAMSGSMFSLSPGVGLRWKLGQHLALGLETNAQLFIAREVRGYYYSQNAGRVIGINAKVAKFSLGFIF